MPRLAFPRTRQEILDRYYAITDELNGLYAEQATAQVSELQAKSNTWMSTQSDSPTVRDRYSTAAAIDFTSELFSIRSYIQALLDERQFLDRLLTPGE
jgi:hypothetical protein